MQLLHQNLTKKFQHERSFIADLQTHNTELSQLYYPDILEFMKVAKKISKKKIIKRNTDHYKYVCNLVDNAIKKSIEARNLVAHGINPKDKKKEQNEIPTPRQAFDDFVENYVKVHKKYKSF